LTTHVGQIANARTLTDGERGSGGLLRNCRSQGLLGHNRLRHRLRNGLHGDLRHRLGNYGLTDRCYRLAGSDHARICANASVRLTKSNGLRCDWSTLDADTKVLILIILTRRRSRARYVFPHCIIGIAILVIRGTEFRCFRIPSSIAQTKIHVVLLPLRAIRVFFFIECRFGRRIGRILARRLSGRVRGWRCS
jgi:hypothetical protein